eukprot:jgi/Hompol1/6833/HPOL_002340-RA
MSDAPAAAALKRRNTLSRVCRCMLAPSSLPKQQQQQQQQPQSGALACLQSGTATATVALESTKTVGYFGALALIFNAATGPGVPFTSANFQSPGWLYTSIIYLAFTIISAYSVLFIIEAMQAIPGNKQFQGVVEYATLINFYFGPWAHWAGQIFLYGTLQSGAIQNIVLASQTTDKLLIQLFGKTCGLALSSSHKGWICVAEAGSSPSPFGNIFMIFTLGFLIILIMTIPLGLVNLDDNMGVQIGAFFLSLVILIQWCSASVVKGLDSSLMPPYTPLGIPYAQVVGTVMLNLSFTTVIPSWINIKSKEVNIQHVTWVSLFFTTFIFISSGIFMALGFNIDSSNNVLPPLLATGLPSALTKLTVYLFAYVMLVPSIPVSMIISKNNLFQNKLMSEGIATFVSFVLPWIACIPLQTGTVLLTFQTWTSVVFVSVSSFIIPIMIYIRCHKFRTQYNIDRKLSDNQRNLLKLIHDNSETIKSTLDGAPIVKQEMHIRKQRRNTKKLKRSGAIDKRSSATAAASATSATTPADHKQTSTATIVVDTTTSPGAGYTSGSKRISNSENVDLIEPDFLSDEDLEAERAFRALLDLDVPDPVMEDKMEREAKRLGVPPATAERKNTVFSFFSRPSTNRQTPTQTSRGIDDIEMDSGSVLGRSGTVVTHEPEDIRSDVPEISVSREVTAKDLSSHLAVDGLPGRNNTHLSQMSYVSGGSASDHGSINMDDNHLGTSQTKQGRPVPRLSRRNSLPTEVGYVAHAFRSVPRWMPISGKQMAWFIMLLTTTVTIMTAVLNILYPPSVPSPAST